MLGSPVSYQSNPLETLFPSQKTPISNENTKKDTTLQLQNHVSSLYEPDPYTGINFHHDPPNRWESIAKEILTPFAPKHPIYNYKKFIPARHQHLGVSLGSPTSNFHENKHHLVNKPTIRRKVSFAENTIQLVFNSGREQDDRELEQRLYKKFLSGSQTARPEILKVNESEELKKSSSLKKFLIERQPSQNLFNDVRQLQTKSRTRPQTAAESMKKDRARTFFIETNGNTVGNFSDEGSRNDKDTSVSSVDGEAKKENNPPTKPVPPLKLLAAMKAAKEKGNLVTQGSRRSLLVTDKPFLGKISLQRDEKSREGSTRNDSKFSVMVRKAIEDDTDKNSQKVQLQNCIRRKSDTSIYSGGECLKLTKHMDIVLPSDNVKRAPSKAENLMIDNQKEEAFMKLFTSTRKLQKKEVRSLQVSPHHGQLTTNPEVNNLFQPKQNESELKTPGLSEPTQKKTSEMQFKTKSKSISQNRPPQLRATTPLIVNCPNNRIMFGLEDFCNLKSKTPSSRDHLGSGSKIVESQSTRNARHGKASFEKRLKNGDLSEALKVVLDLNKKAQRTVFRKKSPERIKTPRSLLKRSGKEDSKLDSRHGSRGDLDKDRTQSPYSRPMSVKKEELKGSMLSVCENVREEASKQTKKRSKKKITFFTLRSKSVPKINELPVLEKIYL